MGIRDLFTVPEQEGYGKNVPPVYPVEKEQGVLNKISSLAGNFRNRFISIFRKAEKASSISEHFESVPVVEEPLHVYPEKVRMTTSSEVLLHVSPMEQEKQEQSTAFEEDDGNQEGVIEQVEVAQVKDGPKIVNIHDRIEKNGNKYLTMKTQELLAILRASVMPDTFIETVPKALAALKKEISQMQDSQERINMQRKVLSVVTSACDTKNSTSHAKLWSILEDFSLLQKELNDKEAVEYGRKASAMKLMLMQIAEDIGYLGDGKDSRIVNSLSIHQESLKDLCNITPQDTYEATTQKIRSALERYGYSFEKDMSRPHIYVMAMRRLESKGLYYQRDIPDNLSDIALPSDLVKELHQKRSVGSPLSFRRTNPLPPVNIHLLAQVIRTPRIVYRHGDGRMPNAYKEMHGYRAA